MLPTCFTLGLPACQDFSVRKGQVARDRNGEVVQQTFVCSCQGYREDRGLTMENQKREPKNETIMLC